MAALLKKIQHIQGFLKGVQALESFEKLREDQFKQCSDFISGSKGLSLESVSSILGVLDASVWNAEQLTELKTKLSEKLTRSTAASEPQSAREPSPPKQKAPGQDYRNLVYRLKPCHYEMLANSKPDCLQALALRAAALGLRNPSEGTLAVLVTLLGWQGFKEEGLELASGYALLVEQKPKFKKLLAAAAPTASEADCLSVLPASWESLPETLRKAAYSDGVFPEEHPQFIRQNVLQVANMLPLRRSNSLVSKPKPLLPLPPAGQTNLGQRFLDLLLEGVGPQVSGSFSVPGLRIFPPARHSSAISLQSDSQGDTQASSFGLARRTLSVRFC